jgi:hypothetical protein
MAEVYFGTIEKGHSQIGPRRPVGRLKRLIGRVSELAMCLGDVGIGVIVTAVGRVDSAYSERPNGT